MTTCVLFLGAILGGCFVINAVLNALPKRAQMWVLRNLCCCEEDE